MPFYAVANGVKPGIYKTWDECRKQIENFKNAKYKKFDSEHEANLFVENSGCISIPKKAQINNEQNLDNSFSLPSEEASTLEITLERINSLEGVLLSALSELREIKSCMVKLNSNKKSIKAANVKRKASIQENELPSSICDILDGKPNVPFKYDKDGFVEVYTDGACENNGKSNAKAGLGVFFGEGHPLNISEPCNGRATNNCGEIQAAIKAVQVLKRHGEHKVCIYTDSQFLINSMTRWIFNWKKKGWKLADGSPVKNKVDFEELDREITNMHVKWTYVKAHCGIFGNEMADQLARNGAELYAKRNKS